MIKIIYLQIRQVRRWVQRNEDGSLETVRSGAHRITTPIEDGAIVGAVENSPFISSVQIREQLHLNCSTMTIRRRLRESGYHARKPARKIELSEAQAAARVRFCEANIDRDWQCVIFTDEKTFSSSQDAPVVLWRKNNTRYIREHVRANATSGRITAGFWGWVSEAGPGELIGVSPPRFNSQRYIELLEEIVIPSVRMVYPEDEMEVITFVQDNCPIHKAARVIDWFEDHNDIDLLDWPAKSPDLNPIEDTWAAMVRSWDDVPGFGVRERTIQQLTNHVNSVWENLRGTTFCSNSVRSMRNRLTDCIGSNGYYIKY